MEYTVWYEAISGSGVETTRSMQDETLWNVPDELEGDELMAYLQQALQEPGATNTRIRILSYELA